MKEKGFKITDKDGRKLDTLRLSAFQAKTILFGEIGLREKRKKL
jgi:hypothetical protein